MSEKGILKKHWIQELTRPAFEEWIDNNSAAVAVIGIGAVEQHGPHLPLGTDTYDAMALIHKVAQETNSVAVVPCWPGYSPHHMDFRGTITFKEETLMGILMDTIGSLADHGVKRFVFYSGHGGNSQILNLAMLMAKRYYNVMTAYPRGPSRTETARKFGELMRRYNDIHSGPTETAMILLHNPELAEMWRLEGWTPKMKLDPKLRDFMDPNRDDYELVSQVKAACGEPNLADYTSDGIAGINDPRDADPELYKKRFDERVQFYVDFINLWKTIDLPPAYRD
jgi:creatinine amidohydrolase/Fe(II)-dependent formamide hydrolase-like protein